MIKIMDVGDVSITRNVAANARVDLPEEGHFEDLEEEAREALGRSLDPDEFVIGEVTLEAPDQGVEVVDDMSLDELRGLLREENQEGPLKVIVLASVGRVND